MDLIGDLGGTNLRLARVGDDGSISQTAGLKVADHPDLASAVDHYLQQTKGPAPQRAAFAIAGPVNQETLRLTNAGWAFTRTGLCRSLGLNECVIINDFVAQALALPHFTASDVHAIGPARTPEPAPKVVLGPGTGLGVAALIPCGEGWLPVATEGGHMSLSPANEVEDQLFGRIRRRHGHCSGERLLSGPGLLQLYRCLAEMAGEPATHDSPDAVSAAAVTGSDRTAGQALSVFFALLGSIAGDLALAYGAHGGVYLSGGILRYMTHALAESDFRRRFTAKGRFHDYLDRIPAWLVLAEEPALRGLAARVSDHQVIPPGRT